MQIRVIFFHSTSFLHKSDIKAVIRQYSKRERFSHLKYICFLGKLLRLGLQGKELKLNLFSIKFVLKRFHENTKIHKRNTAKSHEKWEIALPNAKTWYIPSSIRSLY